MSNLLKRLTKVEQGQDAYCLELQKAFDAWIVGHASQTEHAAFLRWLFGPYWENGLTPDDVRTESRSETECRSEFARVQGVMADTGRPQEGDAALLAAIRDRMPDDIAKGYLHVMASWEAPHSAEWLKRQ